MANAYPFFAFCSAVLNDPAARYEFTTDDMQDALIASYGLSAAQTAAVKKRDSAKIIAELEKELNAVKKSPNVVQSKSFICW